MSNKILIVFFLIGFLITNISLNGQSRHRTVLKEKLIIYYVSNPNSTSSSTTALTNAEIYNGTYSGSFWTNSAMRGPQRLVKALLCATDKGGDTKLQRLAAEIIKIRNKPTVVYLLNDATISINQNAENNYGACNDGSGKSWPCASAFDLSNRLAGQMCLGTNFLSTYMPSGRNSRTIKKYRFGTFLHELTHTQDNADGRAHLHIVGNRWYGYGRDGDHYGDEVLPDVEASYKEAIANAFGMYYDQFDYNQGFTWFAEGGTMIVEHAPPGMANNQFVSLQKTLQDAGVRAVRTWSPQGVTTTYSMYRMGDIPVRYIMYNETMLSIILESMRKYGGTSKYMRGLRNTNDQLFNVCTWPIAVLFDNMCAMGLPSGVRNISDLNTSPANAAFLFPVALADFFSGYKATDQNNFRLMFEDQQIMTPWINYYYEHYRAAVRAAAPLQSTPGGNPINSIKGALGMN